MGRTGSAINWDLRARTLVSQAEIAPQDTEGLAAFLDRFAGEMSQLRASGSVREFILRRLDTLEAELTARLASRRAPPARTPEPPAWLLAAEAVQKETAARREAARLSALHRGGKLIDAGLETPDDDRWARALAADRLIGTGSAAGQGCVVPLCELMDTSAVLIGLLPVRRPDFPALVLPDDTHLLTVMGSRGGKGACHIVPNVLLYGGSLFVLDIVDAGAADGNYDLCHAALRRKGRHVVRFNPLDPDTPHTFNPLDLIPPDPDDLTAEAEAKALAELLIDSDGPKASPFWRESALAALEAILLHVAQDARHGPGTRNMGQVVDLVFGGIAGLVSQIEDSSVAKARQLAVQLLDPASEELQGNIFQTLKTALRPWSDALVRHTTARSSFDPVELKARPARGEAPMALFFQAPVRGARTYRSVIRTLTGCFLQSMRRPVTGARTGPPVLFLLDEFCRLGHMEDLVTAYTEMAKYGVRLWAFVQTFEDIRATYGEQAGVFREGGALILGSTFDPVLADWVEKFAGELPEREERYFTSSESEQGTGEIMSLPYRDPKSWNTAYYSKEVTESRWKRSEHVRFIKDRLATPDMLGRLPDSRQLVFVRGRIPALVTKLAHFDPLFAALFGGADPQLEACLTGAAGLLAVHAPLPGRSARTQHAQVGDEPFEADQGRTDGGRIG